MANRTGTAARVESEAEKRDWSLWAALVLLALFLLTQYGDVRQVPFINDDYIFLDKTRSASFGSLWAPTDLAFHWYRPWSRELHYWAVQKLFGAKEAPFHVVSVLLALGTMLAFFAFARRLAGPAAATIATAGWAVLAAWAVPIVWIAGVQDLWMLLFAVTAIGAVATGRIGVAAVLFALALLSKESAAVVPAIALAYERFVGRRSWVEGLRRTVPLWIVLLAWAAFHPLLGGRLWNPLDGTVPPAPRSSLPVVLGRTLLLPLNLDAWAKPETGWARALGMGAIGAVLLAALVMIGQRAPRTVEAGRPPLGAVARFGGVWTLIGLAPLLMPGLGWHNYYALLGVAGAWLAIGTLLVRWPGVAVALIAALALVRAGRATTPSLDWGSEWYQRRAGRFIGFMRADLMRAEPKPPAHSRLYFIRVPSYVGFLAGDGPALRVWYGDSTLRAGFYPTYRPRRPGEPAGEDYFFRYDSLGGWVRVIRGPENIQASLESNPRWLADHEMLAQTLARAEDWPGALMEYQKLAMVQPGSVDYAYNTAVSWEMVGDSLQAARWFGRAASLPGADEEVRAAAQLYRRDVPIPRARLREAAPPPSGAAPAPTPEPPAAEPPPARPDTAAPPDTTTP